MLNLRLFYLSTLIFFKVTCFSDYFLFTSSQSSTHRISGIIEKWFIVQMHATMVKFFCWTACRVAKNFDSLFLLNFGFNVLI